MKKRVITLLAATCCSLYIHAQLGENTRAIIKSALHGVTYELHAGFNIGGTSPLPIPAEIRSVDKYTPPISFSISGSVNKKFGDRWGLQVGIRLEDKGMKTGATVKQYHMSITGYDGEQKSGYWTGKVRTQVSQSTIAFPVVASYSVSPRWDIKLGPYVSYVIEREFTGTVFDGYLREGTPVGDKIVIADGNVATYDFSKDMRRFQWGMQLGAEWKAFKHFSIFSDLSWGLNDIFKKDFETITFNMYPIYLTMGFGYVF